MMKSFDIRYCLVLTLISIISLSPRAEAASNDYTHQIGSACTHETQDVVKSPTQGGGLICLKDKSGLHWQDDLKVVVDAHLESILPRCGREALYSPPIKVSTAQMKIFMKLATDFFRKMQLLPFKITQVLKAVKKNQTVGTHPCTNGVGAPLGAWGGFMPLNASDGWELQTSFKVNRYGNAQFLRIAKIGTSYKIVDVVSGG